MLVWVTSVLERNEDEAPSIRELLSQEAFHFIITWGNGVWRSMPQMSSESASGLLAGFQISVRDDSTVTTWLMSGLWWGLFAQQWKANSAILSTLGNISMPRSIAGSMAFQSFSSFDCKLRNQVTKCLFSSVWLSSSAFRPVINSISIAPKLKTSVLVVILPVTVRTSDC